MKDHIKEVKENTAEIERMTKEIEDTDVLDMSKEGVHVEKVSVSKTVNSIKKSLLRLVNG